MAGDVRILLLGDSHLGFDLPVRPRAGRRRRGYDFLANYAAALAPATHGEIDVVVHAGDVFNRSSVDPSVAYQAYEPLRRVADLGIPVLIVPGNHERSRLPHRRFLTHPKIHVFDRPRTFVTRVRGTSISLSGFPYERQSVRARFPDLLAEAACSDVAASCRLLCVHHCIEGATVGPGNFTFTTASDVIRARDITPNFAAVFSGHIHRHQVLKYAAPVLYPGSIERTSFAEMEEPKGFLIVHIAESEGDHDVRWEFRRLPARPMVIHELDANVLDAHALESAIRTCIDAAPRHVVMAIRVEGTLTNAHWRVFSSMRAFVPDTMNVEIKPAGGFVAPRYAAARSSVIAPTAQLSFY